MSSLCTDDVITEAGSEDWDVREAIDFCEVREAVDPGDQRRDSWLGVAVANLITEGIPGAWRSTSRWRGVRSLAEGTISSDLELTNGGCGFDGASLLCFLIQSRSSVSHFCMACASLNLTELSPSCRVATVGGPLAISLVGHSSGFCRLSCQLTVKRVNHGAYAYVVDF